MIEVVSVYEKTYFYNITVRTKQGGELIQFLEWGQLLSDIRKKYDWYFKYRAALAQVQHPRAYVEVNWGVEEPNKRSAEHILKNKIAAKKRTITKYRNLLEKAEKTWSQMFPIEDDLLYQRAVAKIKRLEAELHELTIS